MTQEKTRPEHDIHFWCWRSSGTITAIVLGAMAVFLQTYQRSLIRSVQTSARQSVAQVGKTVEDYLDDVNSLMELLERKLEDPRQDRDDFFAAFLQIRPDVVAVTTYDAAGRACGLPVARGKAHGDLSESFV